MAALAVAIGPGGEPGGGRRSWRRPRPGGPNSPQLYVGGGGGVKGIGPLPGRDTSEAGGTLTDVAVGEAGPSGRRQGRQTSRPDNVPAAAPTNVNRVYEAYEYAKS